MMVLQMFDKMVRKIDGFLFVHPSATVYICGNFNIHKEWQVHSNRTNEEGKYCHDFSITYKLAQIIESLLGFPIQPGIMLTY